MFSSQVRQVLPQVISTASNQRSHMCYSCCRPIHFICARPGGKDGYGSSVCCPKRDLMVNREQYEVVRVGIIRKQDVLH